MHFLSLKANPVKTHVICQLVTGTRSLHDNKLIVQLPVFILELTNTNDSLFTSVTHVVS